MAEYLKSNLFKNVSNHPDFVKDTKSAIGMLFLYLSPVSSFLSVFVGLFFLFFFNVI